MNKHIGSSLDGCMAECEREMTETCPCCAGDPNKPIADTIHKLWAAGCVSTAHNPGGAEFHFADGSRLQIMAMCNTCDERKMLAFLGVSQ